MKQHKFIIQNSVIQKSDTDAHLKVSAGLLFFVGALGMNQFPYSLELLTCSSFLQLQGGGPCFLGGCQLQRLPTSPWLKTSFLQLQICQWCAKSSSYLESLLSPLHCGVSDSRFYFLFHFYRSIQFSKRSADQ